MRRIRCWLRGYHDHYTVSIGDGPFYAPPCWTCGARNAEAARQRNRGREVYETAAPMEHRTLDVRSAGWQCPACGEPVDAVRVAGVHVIGLEPCGHLVERDELLPSISDRML